MTLPALAGSTRIHTLPGRPPFMLFSELAEALGLKATNARRQFHRNMHKLPKGTWFALIPHEYREKLYQNGTTSQGMRADVEQYGLTEIGVLILLRYLTGPGAEAGAAALITSLMERHVAEREALLGYLSKDKSAFIGRSSNRALVEHAAQEGWSFGTLAERSTLSLPKLIDLVQEMRVRGFIGHDALLPPVYMLQDLAQKKASRRGHLEAHEVDARQLLLGLEG